MLRRTGDADAADEHGSRGRRTIVRGNDSDHAGAIAEPQHSRTIPDCRGDYPDRQALTLGVDSDSSGCRIQAIESAPRSGVDVSGGVLDDGGHFVA
jgi:hypothetical protein